jgi:hypothetical protein
MTSTIIYPSFDTSPASQSNATQQFSLSDHSLETLASMVSNFSEGLNLSAMVNSVENVPNVVPFEPQVPGPWKPSIGSPAITQASSRRRKKSATFHCPYPECRRSFTAKHNLDSKQFYLALGL